MKTIADKRLFWYLKEGTELDITDKAGLDQYVQQVLTRGRLSDVRQLFQTVAESDIKTSLARIARFLPPEVRRFWEDALGDFDGSSEKDS